MSDPALVQFAGDNRTLTVLDSHGNTIPAAAWSSSNAAVATVDSSGTVHAVAPGTATIVASTGGGSASASMTVTGTAQNISDVYAHFPLAYKNGPVALYSDISTAFTALNGQGLTTVWNYFSKTFSKSLGGHAVVYYTQDPNLYAKVYAICGGNGTPPGTKNTSYVESCYDASTGIQSLIMMPTTFPNDWPRMQDEVGHQFLDSTYRQSQTYTWVYEGFGMSWNGGAFDSSGNLVWGPVPSYLSVFKTAKQQGSTVTLNTLVNMPESTFYGSLYSTSAGVTQTAVYFAQSMMFVCYLYDRQRAALNGLIAQWNSGAITTNAQTLQYIEAQTNMSIDQLDAAYTSYTMNR